MGGDEEEAAAAAEEEGGGGGGGGGPNATVAHATVLSPQRKLGLENLRNLESDVKAEGQMATGG